MVAKAIAVIDDEIDLVNLFQEALENNGFEVNTFIEPYTSVEHFREKNPRIRIDTF